MFISDKWAEVCRREVSQVTDDGEGDEGGDDDDKSNEEKEDKEDNDHTKELSIDGNAEDALSDIAGRLADRIMAKRYVNDDEKEGDMTEDPRKDEEDNGSDVEGDEGDDSTQSLVTLTATTKA